MKTKTFTFSEDNGVRSIVDIIDEQVNYIVERRGTPHSIHLSHDLFKRMMIASGIEDVYALHGSTGLVFRSSTGDIPIKIVHGRENYAMVEDYLDILAEQELLGEE